MGLKIIVVMMMRMFAMPSFIVLFFISIIVKVSCYPHIIAHRGASGYLPEHSIPAYELAINLLTNYIEPDLCLTKDGIFIAMHDLLLDDTTNVADISIYKNRISTKIIDGKNLTGYYVSDFLYSELQILRLKQRLNGRSILYDGLFQIPSLEMIIQLVQKYYYQTKKLTGIVVTQTSSINIYYYHIIYIIYYIQYVYQFVFYCINTIIIFININYQSSSIITSLSSSPSFSTLSSIIFIIIIISLSHSLSYKGLYLELKHPDYYHSLGFNMEDMLLTQLQNAGYIINENYHDHHHKTQLSSLSSSSLDLNEVQPIVIQCFDENSLRYLRTKTTIIPLVQLLEHQSILFWTEGASSLSSSSSSLSLSLSSPSSVSRSSSSSLTLQQISTYAQAIGPTKEDFGDISYNQAIKYIQNVKKYHLYIHPWTFRADREIILKFNNDFDVEQMYFYCCLGEDDNDI